MSEPKKKRKRTRTPLRVLMYLAKHGEANKWQLSQGLKKAYSNIHASMAKLLEQDLIYISGRKEGEKKPPSGVKYYDLTFFGLLVCLLDERSWQHIDEIATQKASEFPLIFGKWSFFIEKGLKKEVIERFKNAIPLFYDPISKILQFKRLETQRLHSEGMSDKETVLDWATSTFGEKHVREIREAQEKIVSGVLGLPRQRLTKIIIFGDTKQQPPENQVEFMSILKEDPDLNQYIRDGFDEQEKEHLNYVKNIRSWKSLWESSGEKPTQT